MIKYKVCTHCKEEKLQGLFPRNKLYPDGFCPQCSECMKRYRKSSYGDKEFGKKKRKPWVHSKFSE